MLVTPATKAIRPIVKVNLVNGVEHRGCCALYELIFQGQNAERPEPSVTFRDVGTPDDLCAIRPALESRREIDKMILQILFILVPADTIHAERTILAQRVERLAQTVDGVDLMP